MSFADEQTNLQRAVGAVLVGVRRSERGTVLESLHQKGCLKSRFPRASTMEAVLINTSGGVTDGDQLDIALEVARGAELTVSTPSAEKIYRALPGAPPARIIVTAKIADGATLDYLPQETLLFEHCALDRTLAIDLHPGGRFLGVEALLFGRTLSGESLTTLRLRDTLRIRRGGQLILQDGVRLQGNVQARLSALAAAGGGRAVATIVLAAADAEAKLEAVRAALGAADGGASAWNGMLLARVVAEDGQSLRRVVLAVLGQLREKPLPRLWAS